jgi:indolepyruvate decarboxylase
VPEPGFSMKALGAFVIRVREMLSAADSAVVLVDFLAERFGVKPQLRRLLKVGGFPHTTLSMGKGLLDETNPNFLGTFAGPASAPQVRDRVINADVVIAAGVRFTDATNVGYSQEIADERLIDIQPFDARIGDERYGPLPMEKALSGVIGVVQELGRSWQRKAGEAQERATRGSGPLSQAELWSQIERFRRPGDIVVRSRGRRFSAPR